MPREDTPVAPMPEEELTFQIAGRIALSGTLTVPTAAQSVALFAHGSGSSRFSPRNGYVARILNEGGMGTFLFDLLSPEEELEDRLRGHLRFDIELLASRLGAVTDWLLQHPAVARLRIGYFGASTGAAAALVAASRRPEVVGAVVSRGGRPDLASHVLGAVRAPTLLVVGGLDHPVISMNREAYDRLQTEKRMEIVPGATHLFEEPGALEQVAGLARSWFEQHLAAQRGNETLVA